MTHTVMDHRDKEYDDWMMNQGHGPNVRHSTCWFSWLVSCSTCPCLQPKSDLCIQIHLAPIDGTSCLDRSLHWPGLSGGGGMGSPGFIFFFFAILDGLACGSLGIADRSIVE